jgi:hypothetical protein
MSELLARLTAALADRFSVEREIGRGGMAIVLLAHDQKLGRPVALKVLLPDLAASIGADRFVREIEIAAQLTHPNILPLHDCGEADGLLYYVMPYVAGGSLRHRLNSEGRLSLQIALGIAGAVAAALNHAHRHGVIHRDVKPENILFSEGQPVVADFGIARAISSAGAAPLTRSGFPLGTPGYMSPEQASGRTELDARTDVCGLACVVYEMLIGGTPGVWAVPEEVRLGRFQEILPAHRERLDRMPGRVEQVLVKGLAMRPSERFATPVEFVEALATAAQPTAMLSDARVREVVGRAAEQQAEQPTEADAGTLSMGGVEQVAAQVGIAPQRIRDAAQEIEVPHGGVPERAAPGKHELSKFRKGRLVIERTIAGEVPDTAYEAMVHEINTRLGFVGTVSGVGRALHWAGTKPGFVGRDVRVTLNRKDGETVIHVEEHIELRGASIFVPGWGVAGGVIAALGIVYSMGLPEEALLVFALPLGVAGAILTATNVPKLLAAHYRPQLEELANELETIGREALPNPEGRGPSTAL